ncbi:MAG: type VI secretion system protein [Rhodoferax sp.]|jgi:type VI secretion system protein
MTNLYKTCCLLILATSLSACGVTNLLMPKGSRLDWNGLTVLAAEGVNLNTPVALDIVFLRDEATYAMVSKLPASQWFASRKDLVKTFPEGLSYLSMEITPGQTLKFSAKSFDSARLAGALVFADYLTPGEHRMRIDQLQGDLLLQLDERAFSVSVRLPR